MALQKAIKERGLPEGSEWEDINQYDSNESLKKEIKARGLPEGSTWADINQYDSNKRFDKRVNGNSILDKDKIDGS